MEKYLIHSNELHLIDAEKIHQAVEKMVESLDLAADQPLTSISIRLWKTTLKISRKGEKLIMYWESKKIDMN